MWWRDGYMGSAVLRSLCCHRNIELHNTSKSPQLRGAVIHSINLIPLRGVKTSILICSVELPNPFILVQMRLGWFRGLRRITKPSQSTTPHSSSISVELSICLYPDKSVETGSLVGGQELFDPFPPTTHLHSIREQNRKAAHD